MSSKNNNLLYISESSKNANLLYSSKKPMIVFFTALSLIWIVPAGKLLISGQIASSIKLFMFGFFYIVVLFIAQRFFKRMLMVYQTNLDKSIKESNRKKLLKNRR
ncbi:hypothetical protein H2684_08295 [Clostridium sp. cel8]|jgi:heme O synthase-like polyprenyltransferase|uniref:hypothetical protein n=1 Tax=Clostridium sp. cel8 TaxID=2663123 RepID=UPI0015F5C427|nr:hypothetical protein [Clostridium sp. cel8]MBA5851305.1 hypothetical protein [Clostridium sp. cel8]